MSGHANFILHKGAWVGANDSSKTLGFVVLSPVALKTILGIYITGKLRQGEKKNVIGSVRACY